MHTGLIFGATPIRTGTLFLGTLIFLDFLGYWVPLIFWATSDEAHLALLGTFMALSRKHSNFRHSRGRRW